MSSAKSTRFSGGGSSRNFPRSPKADTVQWGGGGSDRIFPWSPNPKADAVFSGWGGVVAEFFRRLQNPTRRESVGGGCHQFSANGALLHFFYLKKGGALAPWAPLNRPLPSTHIHHLLGHYLFIVNHLNAKCNVPRIT